MLQLHISKMEITQGLNQEFCTEVLLLDCKSSVASKRYTEIHENRPLNIESLKFEKICEREKTVLDSTQTKQKKTDIAHIVFLLNSELNDISGIAHSRPNEYLA